MAHKGQTRPVNSLERGKATVVDFCKIDAVDSKGNPVSLSVIRAVLSPKISGLSSFPVNR